MKYSIFKNHIASIDDVQAILKRNRKLDTSAKLKPGTNPYAKGNIGFRLS